MKLFKFALVGCGHIATRHLKIIKNIGILQALVDPDPSKLDFWKSHYHCNTYQNLDQLFKDNSNPIDVLVVCTPNGYHFDHVKQGLLNHCHVICEKPLTIKTSDAILLQQLAAQQQRFLFTVQSMRYNPLVVEIKKQLNNHYFGKILSFQMQCNWNRPPTYFNNFWKGTQSLDGGILFTQFSHYIDVLQWFFGEIVDAQGIRQNLMHKEVIDFEDQGVAQITTNRFIHGGLYWSINAHLKNFEIGLTINCENLTLQLGGAYLHHVNYCSDPALNQELQSICEQIDPSQLSFHQEVYEHFLQLLNLNNNDHSNTDDVFKTIRSIETIYQSTPLI